MPDKRIALVVPCYNESQRLDQNAFTAFCAKYPSFYMVFVNDGSRDDTLSRINAIASVLPGQAFVLHLPVNGGKAEAVRQGFLWALGRDFDMVGYWDADMATPLEEAPAMAHTLEHENKEIILGTRLKILGHHIQRSKLRHVLGRVAATLASLTLDFPVYDTQCGAKIFKNTPALKEVFAQPFTTRWIFDIEVLARFIVFKNRPPEHGSLLNTCIEHPLKRWEDKKGSKINSGSYICAFFDLLKIIKLLRKYRTTRLCKRTRGRNR